MKHLLLLIAASLLVNPVSAKSTHFDLYENFEVVFDQARSQRLSNNSSYNYSVSSRAESIGLIQKFQLSAHVFAGLGLWLGGLEIELETMPSVSHFEEYEVDFNRWLGVHAKIDFADLIPFGNVAYHYESRDTQLRINANAGLKLLKLSSVSLDFDGELSELVDQQPGLVSLLEQDALDKFEDYYLEPVLDVGLSYAFN